MEIGKEITKSKEIFFEVTPADVFILKCVSITNKSQNITWRVLLDNNKKTKQPENEKQTFFEKLY